MGQISITTEDGPQIINIAGDEPTQEELFSIEQQFFSQGQAEEEVVDDTTLKLGTKVFNDEPETVAQGTETSNVSDGPTNPGELTSIGFRWRFGKADNREGKMRVIEETFGEGSAIEFGPGDYGIDLDSITEEIKESYKLPKSGTIRVNKPGYTHFDLVNLGAEIRGPLVASMVAAPFTAGLSLPLAATAIGGAALIGKGVDELQEDLQGVQDQKWLPAGSFWKDDSVVKDMLIEGVIMGTGELILRPVFSAIGRVIKGPGPKYETQRVDDLIEEAAKKGTVLERATAEKIALEEQRALIKKEIGEGARPTLGDATGKMLADRTLAIAEAIFPNNAALRQNTKYVRELVKKFKAGQISETELKDSIDSSVGEIAKQLKTLMKDPNTAVIQANKELNNVITKEIDLVTDIIEKYAKANAKFSTGEAEVLLNNLSQVERLWRSRGGDLYKNASDRLDNVTFPLDSFKSIFNKLDSQLFKEAQKPVMGSETMKTLRGILDKNQQIDDLTLQLSGLKTVGRPSAEKAAQIKSIEAQLKTLGPKTNLSYSQLNELRNNLQTLKSTEAVREISSNTGPLLKEFTDEITNLLTRAETEGFKTLTSRGGARRAAGVTNQTIDAEQAGFQMLRDANKYYADGAKVFLKPEIEALKANINAGGTVDMSKVAELLIQPGKPLYLKQFLNALTFADDVGTNPVRNLSKSVLQDLKSLAEVGDTAGFNSLLKESGIDKKLIQPFEKYAIEAVKQGRKDDTAFVNITSNKASMLENMIQQNTRDPLLKEAFVANLANQWVQNTLVTTSSKAAVDPVGFFNAFRILGPELQNTLFKPGTVKALRNLQDDAFLLSDREALRSLNASNINQITARELVETLQREVATSEQIASNTLTKAMATGEIDSVPQLVTKLLKSPQDFKKFKTAWDKLPANVNRPTFDQVMNGNNGIKQNAMERIFNEAFPEGINTTTLQNAEFGNALLKAINNNERGLIEIFGEGNEALGKGFVKDLKLFGQQAMRATTKSYVGKAGLAAAAYAAAIGGSVAAAIFTGGLGLIPIAAGAAAMVIMPRILRSKGVLKLLTNPRTNARIYNTAKELGVDVGDNRWLMSQVAQESVPLQLRQTINTIVRQFYLQQYQEATKDASTTAGILANQINTPQENSVRVPSASETIVENVTQQDSGTDFPMYRAATPKANLEFLRQIEREKLLGLRN